MFSKELEEVIEAALADGVLTDKERAVLHKRAQAEGVDLDELDVVIDGRLTKIKKETDGVRSIPPKTVESTKVGNVMKCPNCGAPYQPGTGKCPECGHVFQNVTGNSSMKKLSEGVQNLLEKKEGLWASLNNEKERQVSQYIANFPIPTSKDDMIEFITSLDAKRRLSGSDAGSDFLQSAYGAKYKEVVNRAKIIFAGDEQIEKAIKMTNGFSFSCLTVNQKIGIFFFLFFAVSIMLILFLSNNLHHF